MNVVRPAVSERSGAAVPFLARTRPVTVLPMGPELITTTDPICAEVVYVPDAPLALISAVGAPRGPVTAGGVTGRFAWVPAGVARAWGLAKESNAGRKV